MTEQEKRDYQAAWENIRKRGENMMVWSPTISEEDKAEREKQIEAGIIPF
jgi:hypothetical protein